MESSYPDVYAKVNVLMMNEIGKVMHGVGTKNDDDNENVLVNGYHHDCESETVMIGARQDGQANVSSLCAESPVKTYPLSRAMTPSRRTTRKCDPSLKEAVLILSGPSLSIFDERALSNSPCQWSRDGRDIESHERHPSLTKA